MTQRLPKPPRPKCPPDLWGRKDKAQIAWTTEEEGNRHIFVNVDNIHNRAELLRLQSWLLRAMAWRDSNPKLTRRN